MKVRSQYSMTNGRENRKPWQQKRLQRRRPQRRRNTSSSSSLTGGRASVPFFFALCCRSVTPVVFTSPLSLGNAVQWRFAAHPRKNRALVARKSLGRVSSSEPYDAALKRRTTRASVLLRVGIAAEAKLPHSAVDGGLPAGLDQVRRPFRQ